MTNHTEQRRATNLIFTLDLQYDESSSQRSNADGKPGHYIGSGTGQAAGDRLSGTVHWDLYEDQAPNRCNAAFAGTIETKEGTLVGFTTEGYLYVPDSSVPHAWRTESEVTLTTDAPEYAWIDGIKATWRGTFDMLTYRHRYEILLATK